MPIYYLSASLIMRYIFVDIYMNGNTDFYGFSYEVNHNADKCIYNTYENCIRQRAHANQYIINNVRRICRHKHTQILTMKTIIDLINIIEHGNISLDDEYITNSILTSIYEIHKASINYPNNSKMKNIRML